MQLFFLQGQMMAGSPTLVSVATDLLFLKKANLNPKSLSVVYHIHPTLHFHECPSKISITHLIASLSA